MAFRIVSSGNAGSKGGGKRRVPSGMRPPFNNFPGRKLTPTEKARKRLITALKFPEGEKNPKERANIMALRILSNQGTLRGMHLTLGLELHSVSSIISEAKHLRSVYGKTLTVAQANAFLNQVKGISGFLENW